MYRRSCEVSNHGPHVTEESTRYSRLPRGARADQTAWICTRRDVEGQHLSGDVADCRNGTLCHRGTERHPGRRCYLAPHATLAPETTVARHATNKDDDDDDKNKRKSSSKGKTFADGSEPVENHR